MGELGGGMSSASLSPVLRTLLVESLPRVHELLSAKPVSQWDETVSVDELAAALVVLGLEVGAAELAPLFASDDAAVVTRRLKFEQLGGLLPTGL